MVSLTWVGVVPLPFICSTQSQSQRTSGHSLAMKPIIDAGNLIACSACAKAKAKCDKRVRLHTARCLHSLTRLPSCPPAPGACTSASSASHARPGGTLRPFNSSNPKLRHRVSHSRYLHPPPRLPRRRIRPSLPPTRRSPSRPIWCRLLHSTAYNGTSPR